MATGLRARRLARGAAAIGLTLALGGCWLQAGSSPDNNGFNPTESTMTPTNVGTLTEAFDVALNLPNAPVVGPDGLITTDFDQEHVVDTQDVVELDPDTGALRWRTPIGTMRSSATGNPLLAVSTHQVRLSANAFVGYGAQWDPATTLDTRTGEIIGRDAQNPGSSMLLSSKLGTELSWNPLLAYSECQGCSRAYAAWVWVRGSSLNGAVADDLGKVSTPTLGDHWVWIGGSNAAGPVVAGYKREQPCSGDPVPACTPQWRRSVDGDATQPVTEAHQDDIYVATSKGTAYELNAGTGAVVWSTALGAGATSMSPAYDGSRLYFVTDTGTFVVLDAATGAVIGRSAATTAPSTPPVIAGGVVYTGGESGALLAYDAGCTGTGCTPLWSGNVGAGVGSLVPDAGHLYVTTYLGLTAFAPAG